MLDRICGKQDETFYFGWMRKWFWLAVSLKVFVHGDELENYFKEFDAEILPSDFEGNGGKYDGKAIATHLFD